MMAKQVNYLMYLEEGGRIYTVMISLKVGIK